MNSLSAKSFGPRWSVVHAGTLAVLGCCWAGPTQEQAHGLAAWMGDADTAAWTSDSDDGQDLWGAATAALKSGDDRQAIRNLEQLRQVDPNFAQTRDVDYLLLECGLRTGQWAIAWDASLRWIAAQPAALRTTAPDQVLPWTERRAMLGQAYLGQIQAAYQLGLQAGDSAGQRDWLARAEAACREFARLQPTGHWLHPLRYHTHLIALQLEIRNEDSVERTARLQQLSAQFLATAKECPTEGLGSEWRYKSLYYAAVVSEMAGDLPTAFRLWSDLLDTTAVPADVRRSTLMSLADSQLNQWLVSAPDRSPTTTTLDRPQLLAEAQGRYQQIQQEFPDDDRLRVAFNHGLCLRLLDQHEAAVEQFEKVAWPLDMATDPAASALAWLAQFNLARSLLALGRDSEAQRILDRGLQHLNHATETTAAQAIVLRMRLAERAADWTLVRDLAAQGRDWLSQVPDQAPEIEYLVAAAEFSSPDEQLNKNGADRLAALARIAGHPFASQAKFLLIPWQLESATPARQVAARLDLDRELPPDLRPRVVAAAQSAAELLAAPELSIADFPANRALWQTAELERLAQRRQVQQWLARALFKLQEHARAAQAYAALRADFPRDANEPEWTLLQAISVAQSPPSPQADGATQREKDNIATALELLPEALLAAWAPDLQGYGWFIRGELHRLQSAADLAVQAYEQAIGTFELPSDQIMAMGEAIQVYQTAEQFDEIVSFADRWLTKVSGSAAAFLALQRGIAHFNRQDFAAAEADFARVSQFASRAIGGTAEDEAHLRELAADGVFNQGLMLRRLNRAAEANRLWESFLADEGQGTTRELVAERLTEWMPDWRDSSSASAGEGIAETSGSSIGPALPLDQAIALAQQQFDLKQWTEAAESLGQLSQTAAGDDRHDHILYLWGWALRELQQWDQAGRAWETLIEQHLSSSWIGRAQFHLGELAFRAGDYTAAAHRFQASRSATSERAIRLGSMYMEAWSDLNRDQFDSAAKKFLMLSEMESDEPDHPLVTEAAAMVGQCHFRAELWAEAVQAFQQAAPQLEKLRTLKPELYFQSCLNAGRAALAAEQPGQAVGWLTRCVAAGSAASGETDETTGQRNEAQFLLATALRATRDDAGAQTHLQALANRPDSLGLRALWELADLARSQGNETAARRFWQAAANGAFGQDLPPTAVALKARALLEMGLSFVRSANQQADDAVRAEHLRQAKTWLTRAQLQADSDAISQEAERQLQRLGAIR